MRLADHSGNEFQLVILGYQHPDVHEDRWDSNWLVVSGTVATAAGRKWQFSAPCVTTFELEELADWLDELSADGRAPGAVRFHRAARQVCIRAVAETDTAAHAQR